MIRQDFCGAGLRRSPGLAPVVSALAVAMIEATFLRLLMAAVGVAMLKPASEFAAGVAAIDLSPLTGGTDIEDHFTTRRLAEALPERGVTIIGAVCNWMYGNGISAKQYDPARVSKRDSPFDPLVGRGKPRLLRRAAPCRCDARQSGHAIASQYQHVKSQSGWTAETEGGKMHAT